MTVVQDVFVFLDTLGAWDVVLPFMLVFTLVYATLVKSQYFGEQRKNIAVLVSFCIGFFFIASLQLVEGLAQFLPLLVLLVLGGFFVLFIFSALGGDKIEGKSKTMMMFLALILLIVIAVFSFGDLKIFKTISDQIPWGVVIAVVVFVGVVYFLIRGDDALPSAKSPKKESSSKTQKDSKSESLSPEEFYKKYPDAVRVDDADPVQRIKKGSGDGDLYKQTKQRT